MGTGDLSQRVKQQGREANHSPPTSAKAKKIWIYTSTPPYVFRTALPFSYMIIKNKQNEGN
jgi:hypothetical protein